MSELCSEVENMNISREYFSFIKDIYTDYTKYMKQYKTVASEYMKKLTQIQEKYSFPLCDLNKSKKKYKNISTKFIFAITSIIPKIVKQLIDNIEMSVNGIETTIKSLENIIKDKTNIALKYQDKYDEAKSNLLKNYKNIDKLKDLYMNSMSNCEDMILKYYNSNNTSLIKQITLEEKNKTNKKDKKEKLKNPLDFITVTKDQINNVIANSKKIEKQYKNGFESTEAYEKTFNELAEESTQIMKNLSCDLTIKLKDIILDFVVLLKNSFKMPLSEIDTILPEITDFKDKSKYEKIINDSYNLNKKLKFVKPKKYKLKCFLEPSTLDGKYNPNNHIVVVEDGFEELSFIDDTPTFLTIKEISENFELIDIEETDLKLEEEKIKTKELTHKLLSFSKMQLGESNIMLSEEEIKELKKFLDKHHNRVLFLQELSTYRAKGKYDFPLDLYNLMIEFFYTIIDTIERDKDFHCAKNVIILSQTYYYLDNGRKKYLQEKIKQDNLFSTFKFWKEYLEYSIEKEIVKSIKTEKKNGTLIKETQKESDDLYSNIVFAELVPISDNMIEFGLDRKKIKEIIKPIIKHYNMNEQSITIIDDIIHKNSERKSILLNEEIKQIDLKLLYQNYKNFDSGKKLIKINEKMSDKIYDEKNEVEGFNVNDIYEDIENEENNDENDIIKDNIKENNDIKNDN